MGERYARRWQQLEADAELEARLLRYLELNGGTPESGMTALETVRTYARVANDDGINGTSPFSRYISRNQVADEVAKRTTGDAKTVRRLLDFVDDADLFDGVADVLAKRDKPPREEDFAHVTPEEDLRARLGAELAGAEFRHEAHREARAEAVASFLHSDADSAPSIVETVSAAWSAREKENE